MSMYSSPKNAPPSNEPRPSSTVVVVRPSTDSAIEVLLLKRHHKSSFMAGAYVYPGGALSRLDFDKRLQNLGDLDGRQAVERLQDYNLDAENALALHYCAIREMFEECGILAATEADGSPLDLSDAGRCLRIEGYRKTLHNKEIEMAELVRAEQIRLAPSALVPFAHWITPEVEPKRFSTRFFITALPPGMQAVADDVEVTELKWIEPGRALKLNLDGKLKLMPPTLKTIEEIAEHKTVESLLEACKRKTIQTVLPRAFADEKGFGVIFPEDPEYDDPQYKQKPQIGKTCRVVFRDNRWLPVKYC